MRITRVQQRQHATRLEAKSSICVHSWTKDWIFRGVGFWKPVIAHDAAKCNVARIWRTFKVLPAHSIRALTWHHPGPDWIHMDGDILVGLVCTAIIPHLQNMDARSLLHCTTRCRHASVQCMSCMHVVELMGTRVLEARRVCGLQPVQHLYLIMHWQFCTLLCLPPLLGNQRDASLKELGWPATGWAIIGVPVMLPFS